MIYSWFLIFFLVVPSFGQQYYDHTLCSSDTIAPGTRYSCTSSKKPCRTFLVYRANDRFSTISNISNLFGINPNILLPINKNVSPDQILETGHEILVPITCSCTGQFSQANFTYKASEKNETLSEIACGIFQGLVKSITLTEENHETGSVLNVPLKCACPDNFSSNGEVVKYLVTYPFIERDYPKKVGEKFNVSVEEICRVNNLGPNIPTVFPNTTVLVPLKDEPFINFTQDSDPPTPQFLPTKALEQNKPQKNSQMKKLYIAGSLIAFSLIIALLAACALYIKALKKFKAERNLRSSANRISSLNSCSTPRSSNSCLSPDLLLGIKYSISMYTVEELKAATKNFDEGAKIGDNVYKGSIYGDNGTDHDQVMIKRLRFENTRRVIDVHSRINHVNIVRLHGVCYGGNEYDDDHEQYLSWSYLVFEFPFNGSLRGCLLIQSASLHWLRRTQIAFDVATGLHYLHCSVTPAYTHLSLNSSNIFLTSHWRAKITVFGNAVSMKESVINETKEDVFAFGVVLMELISGKEGVLAMEDGMVERESITFLGGGMNEEGGCFDQLRKFVDPCLKDDYPLAEALCMAVLAGSCVEDDPLHRPSMDDVLKVLARMV